MRCGEWGAVETTRAQEYKVCPHLFIFILRTDYMNFRHVIPCHINLCQLMTLHRPTSHQPTHEVRHGQHHTHPIHPTHHMSTNHTHKCDQTVQTHQVYNQPPTHQVGCNQLCWFTPPPPTPERVPWMIWQPVHFSFIVAGWGRRVDLSLLCFCSNSNIMGRGMPCPVMSSF